MPLFLRNDSDLQWVLASRLLDNLHEFTRLLDSARRGRLPEASRTIPSPLQDNLERPITESKDIPDLDVEINLPGK